jgi:hypothetical protein
MFCGSTCGEFLPCIFWFIKYGYLWITEGNRAFAGMRDYRRYLTEASNADDAGVL